MTRIIRHMLTVLLICGLTFFSQAQINTSERSSEPKPYRILTSGKQVTIKSTRDISSVMVWSSGGKRIVEQKDINGNSFSFRVNNQDKLFFIMMKLSDGKVFSEKLGIQ